MKYRIKSRRYIALFDYVNDNNLNGSFEFILLSYTMNVAVKYMRINQVIKEHCISGFSYIGSAGTASFIDGKAVIGNDLVKLIDLNNILDNSNEI